MKRSLKFGAVAIATAAIAAYIVEPRLARIAKLRIQAWKASRDLPYRVSLRRRTDASYGSYWAWVSIIGGKTGDLGAIEQLELSEALAIARRQWKTRKEKPAPGSGPAAGPASLVAGARVAHRMSFTPIEGDRMRIDCTCGEWQSSPTLKDHHFEPGCAACDDVMREWEEHAGTARPPVLPAEPIQPGQQLTAREISVMDLPEFQPDLSFLCTEKEPDVES